MHGIQNTADLQMLIKEKVDVTVNQALGLSHRATQPSNLTFEKADEYTLEVTQRVTELWTINGGTGFRTHESASFVNTQDQMYEIIQFKTEDEFFLQYGFEYSLIEKFRSENKRDSTAYGTEPMYRNPSMISSVVSDAIPGMKEMNK